MSGLRLERWPFFLKNDTFGLLRAARPLGNRHTEDHQGTEIDIWEFLDVVVATSFHCTSLNNFVVAGKKAAKNS